jgi:elongation factor G
MILDITKIRNIGISAHIDSGKTTLSERILYYTNRIHRIREVKDKEGGGATLDWMELERERGITITSAATYCEWRGHHVNLIDTPGHVDFTIEVERSLRVLDGAILVLCGVAGVQSQSMTVDRQMRRYKVPRLAFVNKLDRSGANPLRVVQQLREKLALNAVLMQIPIGLEADHAGVIDLVTMRALHFDGDNGEKVREAEIPAALVDEAEAARENMLDAVSMFSDELTEAILEEKVSEELIQAAVRRGTLALELVPVFLGSAYKNKGVQPLLDAVTHYLPSPAEVQNNAVDLSNDEAPLALSADAQKPLVALAFKLEDGRYGQLTYLRVYQGSIARGSSIVNSRTRRRHKVGRLVRMHADQMEDIDGSAAGDIIAMFGIECASGDTFTDESIQVSMTSMHVPNPVISLSIRCKDQKAQANLAKALGRFTREDPTFRTWVDEESQETIISGMGELHLEVYVERMRREYGVTVETGAPQVAYRETISQRADFNYTHKKQTGGSGQYARVAGYLEPGSGEEFEFVNEVRGGAIPTEFIPSVEKGVRSALPKGSLIGFPVIGLRAVINDGQAHSVDSSDLAFQTAARDAFREAYPRAKPIILEPVMKLGVEGPVEFQGQILKTIMQRRGTVIGTTEDAGFCQVEAEVPLAEMFGYATDLRSGTQGKAEFTLEFARYLPAPSEVSKTLVEEYRAKAAERK